MATASDQLPDNVHALRAALIETRAKLSGAQALIEHLQLVVAKMKREMFGPRSERSQRLLDQLELQLEELAAAAMPCDCTRLCRAEPAGDDPGRQICQSSAAQPAERAICAGGDRAFSLDHGRSCWRLRGYAHAALRADQEARVCRRAHSWRRHHGAGAGEGEDPHRAALDL